MSEDILKLSREEFVLKVQKMASGCDTPEKISEFEEFLEDLSYEESKGENREVIQKIIDNTLIQIDSLLGKNVLSKDCKVEEEDVVKVKIENNVVVGFESVENKD